MKNEEILREFVQKSLEEAGFGKKTMLGLAASAGLYSGLMDKPRTNKDEPSKAQISSIRQDDEEEIDWGDEEEEQEVKHIDFDFEAEKEEDIEPRQLSFKETVPIIMKASKKFDVPPALIHAVIRTESNFNAHAVSSAGALGMMQLMPATAERFGVQEPFDPEQNIMGGTKYLKFLLNRYEGDLELTIAAYNSGERNVDKHLRKNPENKIPPFAETQRYVPAVLQRMESSPLK